MTKKFILTFFIGLVLHPVFAGWVIVQKNTDAKGASSNETIYVEKNILKKVTKNLTVIFDLNQQKITVVSDEKKAYYKGSSADFKAEVIKIATAKFQELIKKAPADKKAGYEAVFKTQMKNFDSNATEKKSKKVEVKSSSDMIYVIGYKGVKYQVFVNEKLKMEVWSCDKLITNVQFDINKFAKMTGEMSALTKDDYKNSAEFLKLFKKGYALKTIEYSNKGNSEIMVISATQKKLTEADLGFPAGYKKADLSEIMSDQVKF